MKSILDRGIKTTDEVFDFNLVNAARWKLSETTAAEIINDNLQEIINIIETYDRSKALGELSRDRLKWYVYGENT